MIAADRIGNDLVITFNDNRSGFYPAQLLYDRLDEVEVTGMGDSELESLLPGQNLESRRDPD